MWLNIIRIFLLRYNKIYTAALSAFYIYEYILKPFCEFISHSKCIFSKKPSKNSSLTYLSPPPLCVSIIILWLWNILRVSLAIKHRIYPSILHHIRRCVPCEKYSKKINLFFVLCWKLLATPKHVCFQNYLISDAKN